MSSGTQKWWQDPGLILQTILLIVAVAVSWGATSARIAGLAETVKEDQIAIKLLIAELGVAKAHVSALQAVSHMPDCRILDVRGK